MNAIAANIIIDPTLEVMASMLSSMLMEFIMPTTQKIVMALFIMEDSKNWTLVLVIINIIPQLICTNNLSNGLVLYASSAKPIKKAKTAVSKRPIN